MKRIGFYFMCFFIIPFSCGAQSRSPSEVALSPELRVREIQNDVFLVTHSFPWPGNSLLVRMHATDWVWADTPYTPEATALVIDWLYKRCGGNISLIEINTGFHIDNLGGNGELRKRNIPVYGSNLTVEFLETKSKNTMAKMLSWLHASRDKKYRDVYQAFVFHKPNKRFDIKTPPPLRVGSETVDIFFPGPTHTYDNLVVYFPSRKLLFGGCMVLSMKAHNPGFVDDGNVREWPWSLEKVLARYRQAVLVVPGHGDPGGPELIRHTIDVLQRNVKK